jgi:hypothetical protein
MDIHTTGLAFRKQHFAAGLDPRYSLMLQQALLSAKDGGFPSLLPGGSLFARSISPGGREFLHTSAMRSDIRQVTDRAVA